LIASTKTSAAFRAGTPKGPAAGPERKVTTPTRMGLAAAAAGAAFCANAVPDRTIDTAAMVNNDDLR